MYEVNVKKYGERRVRIERKSLSMERLAVLKNGPLVLTLRDVNGRREIEISIPADIVEEIINDIQLTMRPADGHDLSERKYF